MFWLRIRLGGRVNLGVLDTGATISILAKIILPCGSLKNTMNTAAIRMGNGHVVHSCGDCEVEVPMGSRTIAHRFYVMETEAFDFVLGTDFFVQHSVIQSLTLQAPYLLYVDHASGRESVPLEQSEHASSYLRLSEEEPSNMIAASEPEDYQLLGEVLDQGLKELGYSREDLSVELFASNKQSVLDLYCSKGKQLQILLALFRDGLREPQAQGTGEGPDQGGLGTFPYHPVFPRLGSPWGQRVLAKPPGQADYQLCSVT